MSSIPVTQQQLNNCLIIFDCDGVLVDSETLASEAFAEQLQLAGFDYSIADCQNTFTGLSLSTCQAMIEHESKRRLPAGFFERLQSQTFKRFADGLQAVAGITELLTFLQHSGIASCVASSGDHNKMQFTLGHTQLLPYFDHRLFSASDVARGKPAPDLFLHAAQQMGYQPNRCIVIEDSLPGIIAAQAAGMISCGYGASVAGSGTVSFTHMAKLPEILCRFFEHTS
jgi:HAD superfamily hydrolase (TIGR01509 family)